MVPVIQILADFLELLLGDLVLVQVLLPDFILLLWILVHSSLYMGVSVAVGLEPLASVDSPLVFVGGSVVRGDAVLVAVVGSEPVVVSVASVCSYNIYIDKRNK